MTSAKTVNTASEPIASDAAADMTWPMPTIVASVFMKAPAFGNRGAEDYRRFPARIKRFALRAVESRCDAILI
jgi:hypothetical protein